MWPDRNDASNNHSKTVTWPAIGMDNNTHQAVVRILNVILADEVMLSMKTRGALLNAHGGGINDQNTLFDLQYKQLNDIADKISNRVRMLGVLPIGSFVEILKNARLGEQPGDVADTLTLLADHETAIRFLREDARRFTEECEDEITHDFLVTILRLHEKMAWMLRATIEPEMIRDEVLGFKPQATQRQSQVDKTNPR